MRGNTQVLPLFWFSYILLSVDNKASYCIGILIIDL